MHSSLEQVKPDLRSCPQGNTPENPSNNHSWLRCWGPACKLVPLWGDAYSLGGRGKPHLIWGGTWIQRVGSCRDSSRVILNTFAPPYMYILLLPSETKLTSMESGSGTVIALLNRMHGGDVLGLLNPGIKKARQLLLPPSSTLKTPSLLLAVLLDGGATRRSTEALDIQSSPIWLHLREGHHTTLAEESQMSPAKPQS